jgi:hypothetical protein
VKIETKYDVGQELYELYRDITENVPFNWKIRLDDIFSITGIHIDVKDRETLITYAIENDICKSYVGEAAINTEWLYTARESAQAVCDRRNGELKGEE